MLSPWLYLGDGVSFARSASLAGEGGKLNSLQALPAQNPLISIPQWLLGDVLRLICIFLMVCDANTPL